MIDRLVHHAEILTTQRRTPERSDSRSRGITRHPVAFDIPSESAQTNIEWARRRIGRPNDLLAAAFTREEASAQRGPSLLLFVLSDRLRGGHDDARKPAKRERGIEDPFKLAGGGR
jgi:hypothetical protein